MAALKERTELVVPKSGAASSGPPGQVVTADDFQRLQKSYRPIIDAFAQSTLARFALVSGVKVVDDTQIVRVVHKLGQAPVMWMPVNVVSGFALLREVDPQGVPLAASQSSKAYRTECIYLVADSAAIFDLLLF